MTTRAALSTWCRSASTSPADFCAHALTLGASGVVLDSTVPPDWLDAVARELLVRREQLPPVAAFAPCPGPRAGRAPALATTDRDERAAAIEATRQTLQLAAGLGAGVVIVHLGRLELRHEWRRTVRQFGRAELDGYDVERLLAQRVQLAPRALDAARFGLDPILDAAAGAGVTVALTNGARWFEIPDDLEIAALCDDFRGAPLAAWHDAAAAHARAALGFGPHAAALALLGPRYAGASLTDAAGLRGGLPWGLGEVDRRAVLAALPETALRVVHCAPGATLAELAAALAAAQD